MIGSPWVGGDFLFAAARSSGAFDPPVAGLTTGTCRVGASEVRAAVLGRLGLPGRGGASPGRVLPSAAGRLGEPVVRLAQAASSGFAAGSGRSPVGACAGPAACVETGCTTGYSA